jgi:asparagine synthase (glutamine-hydrolysing)
MCGIFGSIGVEYTARTIRGALLNLRHRGPDDWGIWTSDADGAKAQRLAPRQGSSPWSAENLTDDHWQSLRPASIILGHTRLSILDLNQTGHQPISVEGAATLVFNGEIYNYLELRSELIEAGHSFRSSGDTEVVLKAYLEWGPRCLNRLNGFFAFAIWDQRTRQLFAARDRLGKKPFYYFQTEDGGWSFASELKALWAMGGLKPALNREVAARYLALGRLPVDDETFFESIYQLPAGSQLHLKPGHRSPEIERYWQPQCSFDRAPREASHQLRQLLEESVRLRYRSDVPVGICLSGGVDSGSLLATSAAVRENIGQGELHTFTATHEQPQRSEQSDAARMLDLYPGVRSDFLQTTGQASYQDFLEFLRWHDEPLISDGIFNQFRFMREVSARGMKVMLSGQGSDELFLGYPWFIRPHIRWLLEEGNLRAAWGWMSELRRRAGGGWFELLRGIASELKRSRSVVHKREHAVRWLHRSAWDDYCAAAYTSELNLLKQWPEYHAAQIFKGSLVGLLKDEDRNSMGNGIETRLPYLDYQLVEWALTLSPSLNLQRNFTKYVVRQAFVDRLPPEILWSKKKQGFYVPIVNRWPEHAVHVRRTLADAACLAPLLNVTEFLKLLDQGQVDSQLCWRTFNLAFSYDNALRYC